MRLTRGYTNLIHKAPLVPLLVLFVSGCAQDETVAAYGAADRIWQVTEIDALPFTASATLEFSERNVISGQAPCNQFSASMTTPYPWFSIGPVMRTKLACTDITAEDTFLTALSDMTLAEVLDDTLILSTPQGRSMVFKAGD